MTFDRPWMLLTALLPLAWLAREWTRTQSRGRLLLKSLALAAVLLALAEPRMDIWETKMTVGILADTSASLSPDDLSKASTLATSIENARGRHRTVVIPFAAQTRAAAAGEQEGQWKLRPTAGEAGRATDLEAAIREATAALPAGRIPKLVLISDGKENRGSIARAAWQARQFGVAIDTYALDGRPASGLRLDSLSVPMVVFSGERFPIDLAVTARAAAAGVVEIGAEGKTLGSSPVRLERGANLLRVHASLNAVGAVEFSGILRSKELGETRFSQAVTLRKPRLLFVSQDPPGTETHLMATLEAAQFEVQRARLLPTGSLADFQMIVFNNFDLESIPPARKADLEDFVKQGGGLLVIGGERNVYVENKPLEDALERSLPAKLAPPRSPEGTCLVLIVDKSSSMEGKKMELARLAAIGVIDNLRAIDLVGVLIFDNSFQWIVPIRRAEDRTMIKRLVAGVTPDGGTQIAPALAEAYRRILPVQATFKHIVLLTDGISEEGDSIALAKESALQRVTISTVGLGQDVNRAYLEKVAGFAKGKSYFLVDPSTLEQILLRDVMEHTGSTAIERSFVPVVMRQAEILDGVGMESAPPLKGYVKFIAKPGADTVLSVDRKDPLLARWHYGLGRAAVFTSDAKSRWAETWVAWQGFDRFWANLVRDLLPHTQAGEATPSFDSASGELVIDYRLARHAPAPARPPDVYAFGPGGFREPVRVTKVAEGVYRGRVTIGNRQGLFRARPVEDSRAFPEVGLYRQEEELQEYGSNQALLRQVAEFTGGRFQPAPSQVFDTGGRALASRMRLWPAMLALAIALNLAELVARKWKGILELLRPRPTAL